MAPVTGPSEIRYGVIGTGMMGIEHINNLLHVPGAVITAVADPHQGSLDWAAAVLGEAGASAGVASFTDHRRLIEADVCDAVVVASPNMTHAEVLRDLLPTDLHVLVEKPLCTTVPDCLEVLDAARDREAILWVGLEYRYMPPVARLVRSVRDGDVGTVQMLAIREHRFPFLRKVGDWNRFNRNTGGTLVEKCCHFFDLMNLIVADRPVRVLASGAQDVNHLDERYDGEVPDILDNAFVIVEYAGGARALLDLCMFAEASRHAEELSVVGDLGKVEALLPVKEFVRGRRADGIGAVQVDIVEDPTVAYEGFHHGSSYLEHLDLAEAIRTGSAPAVGVADGLWSVAMGAAAHRSIEEGRPVTLDELLPADLSSPGTA
ncbi:MAG: Gfo/Idh/MocA family oxidoreductase [Acidobacteria bacterium]|nr:Gfo/Idh/MocA family oxidoreductase [Acidobacteriota bacterium]